MSLKNNVWKYATLFVVLMILLNPEYAELAIFIDSVGLNVFLVLIEVQLITVFGIFHKSLLNPAYRYLKQLFMLLSTKFGRLNIRSVMTPAVAMNVLVISAMLEFIVMQPLLSR